MEININTATASAGELTALIALCASLGGRLPAIGNPVMPELRAPVATTNATDARPGTLVPSEDDEPADATDSDGREIDPAQLDSSGVPWDARIHSTPASINKSDGTYRKRRKIDEVTFGRVHGELAEQHASPNHGTGTTTSGEELPASDTAATPDAPPPPADNDAPPPPADDAPLASGAASAPTADQSAVSTDAANVPGAGKFAGFPEFVSAVNAIKPGGIPYAELNTYAQTIGMPGFKDMKDRPDLWETFFGLAGGN